MKKLKVAQIIDSLNVGGAEMMAVQIANSLCSFPEIESHLIVTRREGPLVDRISPRVKYTLLKRSRKIDYQSFKRLFEYIKSQEIQVLHAHNTSFFLPLLLKPFCHFKLLWHDHHGGEILKSGRRNYPYRRLSILFDYVICVSEPLFANAKKHLLISPEKISFLPNYVVPSSAAEGNLKITEQHFNIVAIAANRHQKDLPNLVKAVQIASESIKNIQLYILGHKGDLKDYQLLEQLIHELGLKDKIKIVGAVNNANYYLKNAQIGILSSRSEGLPLALIEYGMARIPVVSTAVGGCPALLHHGKFGQLVDPENSAALAEGIISVARNYDAAIEKAHFFYKYVTENYSESAFLSSLLPIYQKLVAS